MSLIISSFKIMKYFNNFTFPQRHYLFKRSQIIKIVQIFYSDELSYNNKFVQNYIAKLSSSFKKQLNLDNIFPEYDFEQLRSIYCTYCNLKEKQAEVNILEQSLKDDKNDIEMIDLMNSEIFNLQKEVELLGNEIVSKLYPKEILKHEDAMMEINAGVGGQEAMLFANEMFTLYLNYINYKKWTCNIINIDHSDLGGIRHAILSISGLGAYNRLVCEAGVHRVQRTPKTEKSGRLHTSTTTVSVILQPNEIEVILSPKDLKIETCKSSGKGGQHVNTTDSSVRILHIPTGISAECQNERSQIKNKEMAMKLLRTKIFEKQNENLVNQINSRRKIQVGTANRNEKIRTYNFKDDRITDHRINRSTFGIENFFEGTSLLDDFIQNLISSSTKKILLERIKCDFLEM